MQNDYLDSFVYITITKENIQKVVAKMLEFLTTYSAQLTFDSEK